MTPLAFRFPTFLAALLLGLLAAVPAAVAQQCFKAYDATTNREVTAFCVGTRYYVANCNAAYTNVNYDIDDANNLFDAPLPGDIVYFTYPTPGPRTISQLANLGGPPGRLTSKVFQVYPTSPPRVRFDLCLRNVQVTVTDADYARYTVQFDSRPAVTAVRNQPAFSPNLTSTGAYSMTVSVVGYGGACTSAPHDTTILIPAQPLTPRVRRLDVQAPSSARTVDFDFDQLVAGVRYNLERDTTAGPTVPWTTVGTFTASGPAQTFRLFRAEVKRRHRYRLRVVNGTCVAAAPGPLLVSNEVGSVPLDVAVGNKQSLLRWPGYPAAGTIRYWEVYRNGRRLTNLPASALAYTDNDVACQRRYCYEVAAVLALGGRDSLRARSSDSCVVAASTITPTAATVRASFDLTNNLLLRATVPPTEAASSFEFFQQGNGSVGTSLTRDLLLPVPDTARVRGACYSVQFRDSCSNRSPQGPRACPAVLRVRRSADRLTALLDWSAYAGFGAPQYQVLLLDEQTNGVLQTTAVGPATAFADDLRDNTRQIRRYRVLVLSTALPDTAYSNTVDLIDEAVLRFPTAFTPNGDQLNDTFGPAGRFTLREVAFQVYDRWGREVFATTTPGQAWDGTSGGSPVQPGVFVWRFRGKDATGRQFDQRGTVTVLQ